MNYPKELFNIREDVTKNNLADYDKRREAMYEEILKDRPDFYHRPLRERLTIQEPYRRRYGV